MVTPRRISSSSRLLFGLRAISKNIFHDMEPGTPALLGYQCGVRMLWREGASAPLAYLSSSDVKLFSVPHTSRSTGIQDPRRYTIVDVCSWPEQPIQNLRSTFALRGRSGLVLLVLSSSGCDPEREGLSPPRAPKTVREPLDSHGSRCSAVSMT